MRFPASNATVFLIIFLLVSPLTSVVAKTPDDDKNDVSFLQQVCSKLGLNEDQCCKLSKASSFAGYAATAAAVGTVGIPALLASMGFTATGITAGSWAAWYQATYGVGTAFSWLQSLFPVGAAIILLVADTLINHKPPIEILTRIDWNVLLLFFGLFVWLDGLNSTGIPHRIWVGLNLDSSTLTSAKSLLLFFLFTIIGSNVFSNVPLTLLVLQQVPLTGNHLNLILYLAFLTTIAGNLTLFGSVANLIVAQKALTSSIKYRFNFWTYFKYGFVMTILFSLIGMAIIYGLLQVIH